MIDFEFGSFSVLQLQICNDSAILMVVVDTDMFVFKMATFPPCILRRAVYHFIEEER
jgi:hypothetical protein